MSKARIFNPGINDPNEGDPDVFNAMARVVNDKLEKAIEDLQVKYASGQGGIETSERGPTGKLYHEKANRIAQANNLNQENSENKLNNINNNNNNDDEIDSDDEFLDDFDDELEKIREKRLREMKQFQEERNKNLASGHGEYREISQDDFLPEVTGSKRVVCHFYHSGFPRCAIVDRHLNVLAQRHIECKFMKIEAEKTPFFTKKLGIEVLPTIVCFMDGIAVHHIIGFNGLADDQPPNKQDEWPTDRLAQILANQANVIDYRDPPSEDELRRLGIGFYTGISNSRFGEEISEHDIDIY